MRLSRVIAAMVLTAGASAASAASLDQLAIANPALKAKAALVVSSSVLKSGAPIPDGYTSYGASTSPPLAWRGAPAGARSVAVILEDPDAPTPAPFVHWVIWNLPPAAGVPEAKPPPGAVEGKMSIGRMGYFGPRPPAGPAHHYHFQVFALDRTLDLAAGADAKGLETAMAGHVLASGELVATYQKQ